MQRNIKTRIAVARSSPMRKDRKESNATEFENSTAEASPASRGGATNAKTKTANANTAQISSSRQISFG